VLTGRSNSTSDILTMRPRGGIEDVWRMELSCSRSWARNCAFRLSALAAACKAFWAFELRRRRVAGRSRFGEPAALLAFCLAASMRAGAVPLRAFLPASRLPERPAGLRSFMRRHRPWLVRLECGLGRTSWRRRDSDSASASGFGFAVFGSFFLSGKAGPGLRRRPFVLRPSRELPRRFRQHRAQWIPRSFCRVWR